MACMLDLGDLEQHIWEDIQSDGLDAICQGPAAKLHDNNELRSGSSPAGSTSGSASVSSMSDHERSPGHLARAADDAGSGSAAVLALNSAGSTGPISTADVASSGLGAELGPFGSLEHHQRLLAMPSAGVRLPSASCLNPNRSLVTYKTRALAAAAGSLRSGAVGSSLRLAALMCRSNSGGLADTLMSEHDRAEKGLLMAGLPRSDSLPELSLAPSATDLADLVSLTDLDFLTGMPSSTGLPSLSMLFGERPDVGAAPSAAADTQHQGAHPPAVAEGILHAAAGTDSTWAGPGAAAARVGSRVMSRPLSFSANTATALFSGNRVQHNMSILYGLPFAAADAAGGSHPEPLQPPSLVDYSKMIMLRNAPAPAAPADPAFAAAVHACAQQQQGDPGRATGSGFAPGALGFEGFAPPAVYGRMHEPLMMERQDTFEMLMRQVDQELMAEAETRQYAALELGTIDVPLAAAPAAAVHAAPYISEGAAAAAVPAVLRAAAAAAAVGAAAEPGPDVSKRGGIRLKRRSVFEGQADLLSPDVSAVPGGAPTAAVLETVGPSFANWVAQADPSCNSQASAATAAATAASGASAVPTSPFCLPSDTMLLAGKDGSAASVEAVKQAPATRKQDIARYSRLITCKTYLKRLNITQPMAEHLLPPHDLSLPAIKACTSANGEGEDGEGNSKRGYEQMFRDQIVLVDEAGVSFKVQYEGVSCNAQKHLRLTCGWRDYIRKHGVEVGDTVVFERRGDERAIIYVTLVKAADAPVELGPDTKKRRIGRKQAVQRLD